ncbi:cyanoexosortase A system-associated protein [Aerosakkonema funiforme]|uniref:cyanoexosortase A system-associated protein n=1 Tax=Aerosakkonema funiforme TaxID=1246630 RepID=UPI0035BB3740
MKRWENFRISLLAIAFGGVVFVLGKSIFYPTVKERNIISFDLPAAVSLPEWQRLASNPLVNQMVDNSEYIAGRKYRYVQNGLTLDIEMRYLVKSQKDIEPFGNLEAWIQKYTAISSFRNIKPSIINAKNVGFYAMFVYEKKAYLSACINPSGGSTFTYEQFRRNRYMYDLRFDRFFLWLLDSAKLRDERCLWTQMSVPVNNSSPQKSYEILEKAWIAWYKWWSPRFSNR